MTSRALLALFLPALGFTALRCDVREPYPRLPEEVVLRAYNENQSDMELYVLRGDAREHVAHVCGGGSVDVALEPRLVAGGEVRILAAPAGAREGFETGKITVGSRTYIELDIRSTLAESTYEVQYGAGQDVPGGEDS